MSLSGWAQALTDCSFQPASSPTSNPEAPPCKTTSLMMMHDSLCHGPLRWWWGVFSASCWGMRNCDHLNRKQAAEPLSQPFQWAKERKVGGKSEMDAGGSRKSIAKINKWIPRSTPGTSNISISFLAAFFYFSLLHERESDSKHFPHTFRQLHRCIDKRAEFQRHSALVYGDRSPRFVRLVKFSSDNVGVVFSCLFSFTTLFHRNTAFNNLSLTPESTLNSNKKPNNKKINNYIYGDWCSLLELKD